jgi:beta-lactamase regulating signal transducer with metallopeptidase domain/ABC-type glycerol-3-phosphate transport system substrate-binding protein
MTRWFLSSGGLILFTLALRALLKNRLSLRLRYALWLPVLLRLLIPGSLWALPGLAWQEPDPGGAAGFPRREYALHETREYDPLFLPKDEEGYVILDIEAEPLPEIAPVSAPEEPGEAAPAEAPAFAGEAAAEKPRLSLPLLPLLWAAGAGAILLVSLLSELRFTLRLGRSGRRIEAADCPLPVCGCSWLKTPCLAGWLRPRIYVPEQLRTQDAALRHALAHELAHARHGDLLWARLRCLALALHWFNPLVWLAVLLSKQDGELACDEGAIRRLGEGQRYAYGRTLLRLSCPERGGLLRPLPSLGQRGAGFRERIRRVAKSQKTCAWALILAMTLSLFAAGCAFSEEKERQDEAWYYQSSFTSLELPDEMLVDLCFSGDRLYALTMKEDRCRLFSFDLAGGDRREISLPEIALPELPEEAESEWLIFNELLPGPEGTVCLLGSVTSVVHEKLERPDGSVYFTDDWRTLSFALFLDGAGAIRQLYALADASGAWLEQTDAEGRLYLIGEDSFLRIYDPEGKELTTTPLDRFAERLLPLRDGRVAVAFLQNSGYEIYSIDPNTGGLEHFCSVSGSASELLGAQLLPGGFDRDVLVNTGTLLFGVSDKGEREPMVTWLNADLDGNLLRDVCPGEDGDTLYCAFANRYGSSYGSGIARIRRTREPPTEERTVLTLACMGLDDNTANLVLHFNRTDPEYRIQIVDYSEFNTADTPDAGYTRLSTEIAAGNVPDLFCTADLPVRTYARLGLLEDLWPYIDADTELGGRDALVRPLFEAMSLDGELYQIASYFGIYTLIGPASVVGEKNGWSMEEFEAVCRELPEDCLILSPRFTRESMLNASLCMRLDQFVDWDANTCRFDSEEFRDLVRFTELFPAEPLTDSWNLGSDYERINAGEQLLTDEYIWGYFDLASCNACLGDEAAFVGFPGSSGNGSAFYIPNGLAMSANCPHKDAAWRFLRSTLDRDLQIAGAEDGTSGFPTNREAFDRLLAREMEQDYLQDEKGAYVLDAEGKPIPQAKGGIDPGGTGHVYYIYAMTETQAARFLELVESTACMRYWDDAVMDIVHAELAAYYAGDLPLEEATARIQKRVELYLEEQK